MMLQMKFEYDGQLVSKIFMFESVDARMDRRKPAQVPYYKLPLSLRLWWAKKVIVNPFAADNS